MKSGEAIRWRHFNTEARMSFRSIRWSGISPSSASRLVAGNASVSLDGRLMSVLIQADQYVVSRNGQKFLAM